MHNASMNRTPPQEFFGTYKGECEERYQRALATNYQSTTLKIHVTDHREVKLREGIPLSKQGNLCQKDEVYRK